MNQQSSDDHIPTLTDIIQPGDESMKNHFDTAYFDDDNGLDDEGDDEQLEALFEDKPAENLHDTVALLIQEALNETLPSIEEQLKEQLTAKVMNKLEQDKPV